MGFLRDADLEELPEDEAEAFVKLERISRDRLEAMDRDENGGIVFEAGISYMNEVSALAAHYNIPDIAMSSKWTNFSSEFSRFTGAVDYRTIQIRLTRAKRDQKNSVEISNVARIKIQHLLEKLKVEILRAELNDKRKSSLLDKLADFEKELAGKRFNLAKAMALGALVLAASHDFVGTMTEGSQIVHHIIQVIGHEQVNEDERICYLPSVAPYRELPDFTKPLLLDQSADFSASAFPESADGDDIPF